MTQLLFNTGGQPLTLDDLRLLQDNMNTQMRMLVEAVAGTQHVLLQDQPTQTQNGNETTISAGRLIRNGQIYTFPETTIVRSQEQPIYINLVDEKTEPRLYADGQTRYCQEQHRAFLTTGRATTNDSYRLDELLTLGKTLTEYTISGGAWQNLNVNFQNGYSGYIQVRQSPEGTYISLELTTTQSDITWPAGHPEHWLFEFADPESLAAQKLIGRRSRTFLHSQQWLYLEFGTAGCLLKSETGNLAELTTWPFTPIAFGQLEIY